MDAMSDERIDGLRDKWERALERDRPADAVKALVELEKLVVDEPQWSQRLGEAYRRLGKAKDAEEAFVRAAERYMARGFLPRAIAMAQLVSALNPARESLLARLKPAAPPPRAAASAAAAPRPVPLAPAKDVMHDEVRFENLAEPSSIDFVIEDVSDVIVLDDSVVSSGAAGQGPGSLPIPSEPSIDRLGTMASFRLFAGLSREALLDLSSKAEVVEFVPSAMVIVRDEPAYALYAIVDGSVRVVVRGGDDGPARPEIRLGEGDVFGEGCLLGEGSRQADVRAETSLMTLRIEKKALDEVTERHAEIGDALFQLLARRLVMNLMHSSPLFTAFEPKVRLELAQMFEVRRAEPGTILAQRGKRSDGLYVLLAGNVTATGHDGVEVRVARGSAFGHASLLGTVSADDTVRATSESVLLRLPAMRFSSLAATYPPVLAILSETMGEPLRASLLPGD